MKNKKRFHIAAVSLIEIMMIFTIIGIVTGACVSLTKPKNEYMTKIKLYSAFLALESAGKNIAAETHIDFTTDVHNCTTTRVGNICPDYTTSSFPGMSNSLPKIASRSTEDNSAVDIGLTTNTAYSSLSATRKEQFKYLQSGLCQRLSRTFNIPPAGISCNSTLVNSVYPSSFSSYSPQLYLPNGQVIYINQNLYNDVRNGTTVTRKTININNYTSEANLTGCGNLDTYMSDFNNANPSSAIFTLPHETRLTGVKRQISCGTTSGYQEYWETVLEKNKDYFLIYVDINGKMADSNDKQNGPDKLNKDVFTFRLYRDGTVLPDYYSGFPKKYITAKILTKDLTDPNGNYTYYDDYKSEPIVNSRCYANLTKSYSSSDPSIDLTGICSHSGTTIQPLSDCITSTDDSICKSVINKPSFFIR